MQASSICGIGICCFMFTVAAFAAPATQPAEPPRPTTRAVVQHNPARWETEIARYEKADKENPPPKHGILFIGSSTIRLWSTLQDDFPGQPVINRGFGGSEIADAAWYADRIIFPYAPRMIFLRAGGNDIHGGKSVEHVFADFKAFVTRVHTKLPDAEILYISQCPAPSRWPDRFAVRGLNAHVKEFAKDKPYLKYIETYDMSVTRDGQPRMELFRKDKLHFNAEGYKLLAERIRPFLPQRAR